MVVFALPPDTPAFSLLSSSGEFLGWALLAQSRSSTCLNDTGVCSVPPLDFFSPNTKCLLSRKQVQGRICPC